MGWNGVHFRKPAPIFRGIDDGAYFYFVHSYYVAPKEECVIAGEASYPKPFCAVIQRGNLFATQFHPEKSQAAGLRLLKNFAEL
jgi:glutamine amidotransferase